MTAAIVAALPTTSLLLLAFLVAVCITLFETQTMMLFISHVTSSWGGCDHNSINKMGEDRKIQKVFAAPERWVTESRAKLVAPAPRAIGICFVLWDLPAWPSSIFIQLSVLPQTRSNLYSLDFRLSVTCGQWDFPCSIHCLYPLLIFLFFKILR